MESAKYQGPIKLVLFDVDGVLTDGGLHIDGKGEQFKTFNVRDGLAVALLRVHGIRCGVLSGKASPSLDFRIHQLGMDVAVTGRLEKLDALAKEEQDSLSCHPQTFKMMDGSTIGGGSKVRMQYEVECKCITNRYSQRWDNALGKRADNFVQGLIRDSRLDEVWKIDNEEAAQYYPVSHTGECRCHNHEKMRMQ